MQLYLLIEPDFRDAPACVCIQKSLAEAIRSKKYEVQILSAFDEISQSEQRTFLFLIATNLHWIMHTIALCERTGVHPVLLSPQGGRTAIHGVYSEIGCDVYHSMREVLSYFAKKGRNAPAMYGISPHSLPDLSRCDCFLQECKDAALEDVYRNFDSLTQCFERFYARIDRYDCVICTNDYVAIRLMDALRQKGYDPDRLLFVSYGSTLLARRFYPQLRSVSMCYESFGRAALSVCETLCKNPALLHLSVCVKWEISHPVPDALPHADAPAPLPMQDAFYQDSEVCNLMRIERLLSECDETDLALLQRMCRGVSYEEIAQELFLSLSTVKYRMKQLMSHSECDSKKELQQLLQPYLLGGQDET